MRRTPPKRLNALVACDCPAIRLQDRTLPDRVRPGTTRHGRVWHGMALHGPVLPRIPRSTTPHVVAQYSLSLGPLRCSTLQHQFSNREA